MPLKPLGVTKIMCVAQEDKDETKDREMLPCETENKQTNLSARLVSIVDGSRATFLFAPLHWMHEHRLWP